MRYLISQKTTRKAERIRQHMKKIKRLLTTGFVITATLSSNVMAGTFVLTTTIADNPKDSSDEGQPGVNTHWWKNFVFDEATGAPIRDELARLAARPETETVYTNNVREARSAMISDGTNLYGTYRYGGANNLGLVYAFNPETQAFTSLFSFNGTNGSDIWGQLLYNPLDKRIYGMAYLGGSASPPASEFGTVYSLKTDGSDFKVLSEFRGTNGNGGFGRLATINGAKLYGTSIGGGAYNKGVIFEMNPTNGSMSWIVSFNGTNGALPYAGVTAMSDGYLYGTTTRGGSNDTGVIFRINTDGGSMTVLHHFGTSTNGAYPELQLTEMPTGTIVGGTEGWSPSSGGTYFMMNKDGSGFKTITNFPAGISVSPRELIIGDDGAAYSASWYAGISNSGAFIRIGNDGSFSIVYQFTNSVQQAPNGPVLAPDGRLYSLLRHATTKSIVALSFPSKVKIGRADAYCDGMVYRGLTSKGQTNRVYTSTNLVTWTQVASVVATNGQMIYKGSPMTNTVTEFVLVSVDTTGTDTNYVSAMSKGTYYNAFVSVEHRTTNDCLSVGQPCTNNCPTNEPPSFPRPTLTPAGFYPAWLPRQIIAE